MSTPTFSLRQLSVSDSRDVYDLTQSMPEENGFMNDAMGLPFEDFAAWLLRQDEVAHGVNLPAGYVPQTCYWFFADGIPVGRAKLRHFLSDTLRVAGGHIGYGIAPAYRGKGYATEMLRLVLKEAKALGIEEALVTINPDNLASRRVAEKCGGVLQDENDGHCRYWIQT